MESRIFAAVNVLQTFSLVYSIVFVGGRSLTLPAVNDTLRLCRIRFLHFEWRKNDFFFYVALGMRIMYLTSDRRRNEYEKKKKWEKRENEADAHSFRIYSEYWTMPLDFEFHTSNVVC